MIHSLTLSDVLAEHARSRPQVTAVVDGQVRLTYPELDERVSRLADALAGRGVTAGERVLWVGQNSHAVLELLLACSRLGAIFCPANWRQSAQELRFIVDDLTPRVVFCSPDSAAEESWITDYAGFVAGGSVRDFPPVDDASPTLALYTAAFDGHPHAALLSSAALVAHSASLLVVRQMEPGFTFLNSGPLFHVGTMMFCLATLQIGGTNVIMPAFDAEELCRLVDAEKVTQAFLFGQMIDAVVAANAGGKYDLSSLRFVAHSPEWDAMITVDDSPWCRSKMGGYGQTEVGGMLTFLGLAPGGAGFAGRPSPLVQVRILAPDGTEVPVGEVGEICARGKSLFTGYFARPDLNAAKFAHGWHHTGDLGRREPDGTLTFIGPKLRMIKSGAENIYPAEVERALKSHPAVTDAAVIGVPDAKWHQSVKAIVVTSSEVTPDALLAHVQSQIASYKKPRDIVFVPEIPKKGFTPDYDTLDTTHGGGNYPGT
ncbi:AMP-binding protein [Nonomuraea sediminis]|uniref:AMP-binding protein n=1 Tax=Nonomuraea sediminis TaxID=2835864 RepID=UPI001BDBD21F|nr:AMP-binding protein [Nonomuraea sediminis]